MTFDFHFLLLSFLALSFRVFSVPALILVLFDFWFNVDEKQRTNREDTHFPVALKHKSQCWFRQATKSNYASPFLVFESLIIISSTSPTPAMFSKFYFFLTNIKTWQI